MVDLFGEPLIEEKEEVVDEPEIVEIANQAQASSANEDEHAPAANRNLVGHDELIQQLDTAFQEGRFPHALLLTGPKGIGKATFAYRIARYLLAQESEREEGLQTSPSSSVFRAVLTGAHPDLFIAQPGFDDKKGIQKRSLDADTIRKIAPFMRLRSSRSNGWRVVIVDEAHTMTTQAQNGILKILEEPPKNAVLIIVSTTLGSLLPTIKSRVQHFPMTALNKQDMEYCITSQFDDVYETMHGDDVDILTHLAEGSPGQVLELLRSDGLKLFLNATELLNQYPNFSAEDIRSFSYDLMRNNKNNVSNFTLFSSYLLWILKVLLLEKSRQNGTAFTILLARNNFVKHLLSEDVQAEQIISIYDDISALLSKTERQYLDKENALIQIIQKLKTVGS